MSCYECDEIQDKIFEEKISMPIAYFRIGNANVAIVGCSMHITVIMDKLRGD